MKSTRHPIVLAALFINAAEPVTTDAAVWFVRTNGNDALPGTSWTDAKRTVGSALNVASAGDEIWVAQGTYAGHLIFKPDVALYGGFAGVEATRAKRNWTNHLSILWGTTNKVVVNITNSGPATRLDGFTIGGGNGIHGGGISMVGAGPVIANNTIRNNITDGAGSGISIWGFQLLSSTNAHFPVITNNIIVDNQAINDEGDGAGIAIIGSSPLIAWNVIARNTATRNGGGIACWRHSFPFIANNFIVANSASYDELTASSGGGGIFASATDLDGRPIAFAISAPVIINNVIAANGAKDGGGVSVVDSLYGAATIANNTIVANNGAGIFWANTSPTNDNNIVAFNARGFERSQYFTNEAIIRFNNVFGNEVLGAPANSYITSDRTGNAGNICADPKFANFAIGDFHLQPDSPCVDAGSTALAPTIWVDVDKQPRLQGVAVDIGADESDGTIWNVPAPVVRVSQAGDDSDGSTWLKARKTVTAGIAQAASTGGEVWVAQGTYPECIAPRAFVRLYGGFAGTETNLTQRDPAARATMLDGGGTAPVVYFRNAGYRISALDGFIVQGGGVYTGGDVFHPDLSRRTNDILGGGIYCRVSGPMIANNVIRSNSLGSPFNSFKVLGGGFYGYLSHAEITGNTFAHNEVLNTFDGSGGGAYLFQCLANIIGNTFRFNRALNGAALYGNLSELRVARNVVQTNALYSHAAPVYMGSGDGALTFLSAPNLLVEVNTIQGNIADYGAGLCLNLPFAARVRNNLILDNLAWDYSGFGSGGWGGGIKCDLGLNATGAVVIAHNTIVGNNAPPTFLGHFGGGIALTPNTNGIILLNNIVVSNSSGIWRYPYVTHQPVLLNNCVHDNGGVNYTNLAPGQHDVQSDPQFVNRAAGDFRLLATSPCIDAGTNQFAAAVDFDGVPRPLDGNADGTARWDIGAFEFVHAQVDADGDGMSDAAEVVAGTNPTDPASALRLSAGLITSQNRTALRWSSVAGRSYHIEFRPRLDPTETWHTAVSHLSGSGHLLEWQDTTTEAGSRWYRLGVKRD
ncbi:MAG: DUF1565 domain-containing protein [Verrucomicrobia bacterium]|nr:DUF1565 domain-containing protein [Verrucomicrobiota bacterium]